MNRKQKELKRREALAQGKADLSREFEKFYEA